MKIFFLILILTTFLTVQTKENKETHQEEIVKEEVVKENNIETHPIQPKDLDIEWEELKYQAAQFKKRRQEQEKINAQENNEPLETDEYVDNTQEIPNPEPNLNPEPTPETIPEPTPEPYYPTTIAGRPTTVTVTSATEGYGTTDTLWLWTGLPNYYLAEEASPVGASARNLGIGSHVRIQGVDYVVVSIDSGINAETDFDYVAGKAGNYAASIQTCIGSWTNMNVYWLNYM